MAKRSPAMSRSDRVPAENMAAPRFAGLDHATLTNSRNAKMKLETDRLDIVPEDLALARAAVEGREALAAHLSATIPPE